MVKNFGSDGIPQDFEKNFEHVYNFSFTDNNFDPDMQVSGRLFMRELFLNSQMNCAQINLPRILMWAMLLSTVQWWGGHINKFFFEPEYEAFENPNYWAHHGPMMMFCLILNMANVAFLNFAQIEADKKNMMMKRLSQVIDLYFHSKDSVTIRLPVINIVDPTSIMTWMEIRRLVIHTGSRFQIRIQIYTSMYIALMFILDVILFGAASLVISLDTFHPITWMYIITYAVVFTSYMLGIMYPLAYINEQTRHQIRQLIQFKEVIQRVVRDKRLLYCHPLQIDNRIQQVAIKEYRRLAGDLQGDERKEKMAEMAEGTYETLLDAIESLQLELDFTPIKFLGKFALYPDTLTSILTTILTLAAALFQSNFLPED